MAEMTAPPDDAAIMTGHVLSALLGAGTLVAGIAAMAKDLPGIMSYTLLIFGLTLPPLAYLSWRRSRAAWSFVMSICGVFAVVTLFGAPKIDTLLGVGLGTALLLPVLFTIAVILLGVSAVHYRDQGLGTSKR